MLCLPHIRFIGLFFSLPEMVVSFLTQEEGFRPGSLDVGLKCVCSCSRTQRTGCEQKSLLHGWHLTCLHCFLSPKNVSYRPWKSRLSLAHSTRLAPQAPWSQGRFLRSAEWGDWPLPLSVTVANPGNLCLFALVVVSYWKLLFQPSLVGVGAGGGNLTSA